MKQQAVVLYPYLRHDTRERCPAAYLDEAVSLTQATDLTVV